jgi:hypothetical protein
MLQEKGNLIAKFLERLKLVLAFVSLIQEGSSISSLELCSLSLGYAMQEAVDLS